MTSKSLPVRAYQFVICSGNFLQSILLLLLRITWGWQFFEAGRGKLAHLDSTAAFFGSKLHIPLPYFNAVLASCTETFGGLLLLIGLGSRLVSIPLIITMIVAYITADRAKLAALDTFVKANPFPFLLTAVIVLCFGPGKLSVDYLLQRYILKSGRSHPSAGAIAR
jgi:putative oxidoreductase